MSDSFVFIPGEPVAVLRSRIFGVRLRVKRDIHEPLDLIVMTAGMGDITLSTMLQINSMGIRLGLWSCFMGPLQLMQLFGITKPDVSLQSVCPPISQSTVPGVKS